MPVYKFDVVYTTSKHKQHEVEASSLLEARNKILSWFMDENTHDWSDIDDNKLDIELVETIYAPK